ncbi:hypothetical protein NEOLI_003180 [Neolecta irregularis DAH-3]|uniref:Uncharacterized protein n=1 Tax=Neolecta irregularis (strain DAH-3) TaxID=1198029 RepID=A0A1U7LPW6_NEOID|nr:hypothetical protein NEOLI_003180 [Neolecta irregularis DAH-3]|eukprot:OLL24697.1 hypothetical protein NEOLI_003180 [Neolecta irregularis DAH-3]
MIGLSRNSREPSEESLIFEDVPLPIISREETIRSRYHIPSSVVIVEKPLLTSLNTSNENGKKDLISLLSNSPETVTPLSMDELARLKESQYDQISAKEVSSAAGEARNIKNLKKRSRKLRTLLRTLNESTSTESVIEQDFLRAMKVQIYVLVDSANICITVY